MENIASIPCSTISSDIDTQLQYHKHFLKTKQRLYNFSYYFRKAEARGRSSATQIILELFASRELSFSSESGHSHAPLHHVPVWRWRCPHDSTPPAPPAAWLPGLRCPTLRLHPRHRHLSLRLVKTDNIR